MAKEILKKGSIKDQYKRALEDEKTVLNPVTADTIAVADKKEKEHEENFKEVKKTTEEVVKKTASEESKTSFKVKGRRELGKLITEAKQKGLVYKIHRCLEEGFRYVFETFEKQPLKESEELPAVQASVDIVDAAPEVETAPVEAPVEEKPVDDKPVDVTPEEESNAISGVVNSMIQKTWDTINLLKADIQTLKDEGIGEEQARVLEVILDDEVMHVGMLQNIIGTSEESKELKDLMTAGEEKAEQIISEPAGDLAKDEPVSVTDDEPAPLSAEEVEKELRPDAIKDVEVK